MHITAMLHGIMMTRCARQWLLSLCVELCAASSTGMAGYLVCKLC